MHKRFVAVVTAALLAACQSSSAPNNQAAPAKSDIIALTASNHLQRISTTTGKPLWDVALGGDAQSTFTAHLMALTLHRQQLAVLVRGSTSDVDLVDAASGHVIARRQLPIGLTYRGLEVGPVLGRI